MTLGHFVVLGDVASAGSGLGTVSSRNSGRQGAAGLLAGGAARYMEGADPVGVEGGQ